MKGDADTPAELSAVGEAGTTVEMCLVVPDDIVGESCRISGGLQVLSLWMSVFPSKEMKEKKNESYLWFYCFTVL